MYGLTLWFLEMCIRDSGWSAMLYDVASNEYCFSKKYDLHIIDRVGGGDSFGCLLYTSRCV